MEAAEVVKKRWCVCVCVCVCVCMQSISEWQQLREQSRWFELHVGVIGRLYLLVRLSLLREHWGYFSVA